jgi:GGDEF domain-containing protein
MPFVTFNSATVNLFSFLLGWYSRAIARAGVLARLKAEEVLDPETGLYSRRDFDARAEEEFSRSSTYYLPLTVGVARVDGLDRMPPAPSAVLKLAIARVLKECARPMDVVATLGDGPAHFGLLMVTASPKQAEEIRGRMLAGVEKLNVPVNVRLGLAHFKPGTSGFADLWRAAEIGMEAAA